MTKKVKGKVVLETGEEASFYFDENEEALLEKELQKVKVFRQSVGMPPQYTLADDLVHGAIA